MLDYETLKLIWWLLVGVLLIGFAIMDGHDMGVGTLMPFVGHDDTERRVVINTVAPHWDGNQVWFITAGGAVFAAWPLVYAAAFSGFYWAMLAVLWALFLRPVAFDYRSKVDNRPGGAPGIGRSSPAARFRRSSSAWRSATCCRACPSTTTPTSWSTTPAASGSC